MQGALETQTLALAAVQPAFARACRVGADETARTSRIDWRKDTSVDTSVNELAEE